MTIEQSTIITACHELGGVCFHSTSNVEIPRLHGDLFAPFAVRDRSLDANLHFREVGDEAAWDRDVPLRNRPEVARLLEPGSSGDRSCWYDDDCVLVRDFQKRELHFFYGRESGGYLPEIERYAPEWYVASNLWQVFAGFLPLFDGVMLHGAATVLPGGRAVLFLACDEGGKTTAVTALEGARILSDDQVIVRRQGNGFRAFSTPLGLLGDGPFHAELGGVFLLEKHGSFELTRLTPGDLVPWIWAEHRNYTFFLPKPLRVAVFRFLCDLCDRVPIYRMRFPKGCVDQDALERVVRGPREAA